MWRPDPATPAFQPQVGNLPTQISAGPTLRVLDKASIVDTRNLIGSHHEKMISQSVMFAVSPESLPLVLPIGSTSNLSQNLLRTSQYGQYERTTKIISGVLIRSIGSY